MATAKKLPSGSWRCLVFDYTDDNGKRKYKSFTCDDATRKGKARAEQMASEYLLEKEENKKPVSFEKPFYQALSEYIVEREKKLSPYTIRGYRVIEKTLNTDFKDFCNTNIYKITSNDIQKLIDEDSKTRKPKTIRNHHGLISSTLSHFGIKVVASELPKKVRPDLHIPSDDEIEKLLKIVGGTEFEIPVLLAAFCTMRRGEICALSLDDISGNVIHIKHSLVREKDGTFRKKEPKTYSGDRYVTAPQFVIDAIKEKGYITKLKPESISRMFFDLVDDNGFKHFRFHDLRHYSASIMHALGIPDAYIMERGGWGSDAVLKSVYRHALDDKKSNMNDIANDYFNKYATQNATQNKKDLVN